VSRHLALDLALSTTGAAWQGGSDTYVCPTKLRGGERLNWWGCTVWSLICERPCDVVVIEAPFIHPARPTGAMSTIKLHGVIEHIVWKRCVEYVTITPSELKKWATGKGNAGKPAMCDAARERGWVGVDHNEADAFLLWHWYEETQ